MSRSSFEGFFPAAPAVLQQKKSKAALERKQLASSPRSSEGAVAVSAAPEGSGAAKRSEPSADSQDGQRAALADAPAHVQDDAESVQGDLLNGVGSASSSSTVSSVFSGRQRTTGVNDRKSIPRNTSTPLTNDDVTSPLDKSPSRAKIDESSKPRMAETHPPSKQPKAGSATPHADESSPKSALPGPGENRGQVIVYDPELDKSLSSKERRARKPVYKEIVEEVCLSSSEDELLVEYSADAAV